MFVGLMKGTRRSSSLTARGADAAVGLMFDLIECPQLIQNTVIDEIRLLPVIFNQATSL